MSVMGSGYGISLNVCVHCINLSVYDNILYKHTEYIQLDVGIYCVTFCVCCALTQNYDFILQ